jgi:hypothetical protein
MDRGGNVDYGWKSLWMVSCNCRRGAAGRLRRGRGVYAYLARTNWNCAQENFRYMDPCVSLRVVGLTATWPGYEDSLPDGRIYLLSTVVCPDDARFHLHRSDNFIRLTGVKHWCYSPQYNIMQAVLDFQHLSLQLLVRTVRMQHISELW